VRWPILLKKSYMGYLRATVIEATEKLTGCAIERAYVDKGYRGHKTKSPRRVFISGRKRGVFGVIERELRRRSPSPRKCATARCEVVCAAAVTDVGVCAGFWTPAITRYSARSASRRPKSAKARSRGELGTG
jgi:hypothetical protein